MGIKYYIYIIYKMQDTKEIKEYKKIVSKMILKIYTDQQKIIDKLNIELIELKLILSEHKKNIVEISDDDDSD